MTLYGFLFYVLAAVIVASTAVAITRRNLVHAVVYLIFSYFGTAMLFYLLGAPSWRPRGHHLRRGRHGAGFCSW